MQKGRVEELARCLVLLSIGCFLLGGIGFADDDPSLPPSLNVDVHEEAIAISWSYSIGDQIVEPSYVVVLHQQAFDGTRDVIRANAFWKVGVVARPQTKRCGVGIWAGAATNIGSDVCAFADLGVEALIKQAATPAIRATINVGIQWAF